jgi:hypothetical protein
MEQSVPWQAGHSAMKPFALYGSILSHSSSRIENWGRHRNDAVRRLAGEIKFHCA